MAKLLIFDFDGTIADTKAVYYKAIESELKLFGLHEKDVERAIDLGMSLRKTLANLGLNFVSKWFLHRSIMKKVKFHTNQIKKCKDVDSIKSINEKKVLITNSLKEFALPILRHLKLKKTFDEIYGADDFSDKAEFIKNYLRTRKIEKKDCFYIGDRVADVKLAKKVGCISVVVCGTCAWNSRSELLKSGPDFLLDDLKNLKEIF